MRLTALAIFVGATLAVTAAPASAATWRGYISHPMGFAFAAPGEMAVEKAAYRGAVAGQHDSTIYKFMDEGIEYKVVVTDMANVANESATLLGEAEFNFQLNKKVLMDTFGRVDRQYGRKITIDLPNGGRTTGAFYFINGRVLSLQATVPPDGDVGTPEMGRFVDSLTFFTVRAPEDAIELPAPAK